MNVDLLIRDLLEDRFEIVMTALNEIGDAANIHDMDSLIQADWVDLWGNRGESRLEWIVTED